MCESAEMIGKSTCTSPPQGSKVVSIRPLSRGRRQRDPVGRGVLRHALMLADRGGSRRGRPICAGMHAERKLPGSLRAKEPTMPTAPSEEVVLKWFDELSNWGRWGEDDVLGTLNHITPEARVAAAGLVRDGVAVSCSWDIRTGPQPGSTVENQRYMLSTGLGLKDEGRKNL